MSNLLKTNRYEREIEAAKRFSPFLKDIEFGAVTDSYECPRCGRTQMPRRIAFNYAVVSAGLSEDEPYVFSRLFCTRCVEDETTDEEWAMHWRVPRIKTDSEVRAARDAPWRGYGPLLQA